jgi:hypothetical protein
MDWPADGVRRSPGKPTPATLPQTTPLQCLGDATVHVQSGLIHSHCGPTFGFELTVFFSLLKQNMTNRCALFDFWLRLAYMHKVNQAAGQGCLARPPE